MTKQELYEILELDSPEDFSYFEQFADLMECEDDIDEELFTDVLSAVDAETIGDIIENYYNELTANLPDETQDLYSSIDAVQQRLLLLAQDIEHAHIRAELVAELCKFKEWYTNPFSVSVDGDQYSVMEAITLKREEKLGGKLHRFDFSTLPRYELEELSMNLGSFETIEV